jgi:hypothetical protein
MDRIVRGHAIDVDQIADWEYRGISLGLPAFVDRLAWKTFLKIFHRDPARGVIRGWNMRLEQTGFEGPIKPMTKGGEPITFGHYRVESLDLYVIPHQVRRGLMLDYGRGGNHGFDPTRFLRDPVVALTQGSVDCLLGWSYVDVAGLRMGTPSFFLLERLRPLERVVPAP